MSGHDDGHKEHKSVRSIIRDIIKKTFVGITVMVLLVTVAMLCFMLPPVQRTMRDKVVDYMRDNFGVETSIESLRFFPFNTIGVYGISVCDADSVEMIGVKSGKMNIGLSSIWNKSLIVSSIELDSVRIDLDRCMAAEWSMPQNADTADTDGTKLRIQAVIMKGGCIMKDGKERVSDIDMTMRRLNIEPHSTTAYIQDISLRDNDNDSRRLRLTTHISVADDRIASPILKVAYGQTHTTLTDLKICTADEWTAEGKLRETQLHTADFRHYAPALPADKQMDIECSIRADRHSIDITNIYASNDNGLVIDADCHANGIADLNSMSDPRSALSDASIDIHLHQLTTSADELTEWLSAEPMEPTQAQTLGLMTLTADIGGNARQNIQMTADLNTDAGSITLNGTLNQLTMLRANIASDGIDVTGLTDGHAGRMAFSADIDAGENDAHIIGQMPLLTIEGYAYTDVLIDALKDGNDYSGVLNIADPNGSVTIVGEYGMGDKDDELILTARIYDLMTGRTHLTPDIDGRLNLTLRAEMQGSSIDHCKGNLWIDNFSFTDSARVAKANNFTVDMLAAADNYKDIRIESDNLNACITGTFSYPDIAAELSRQLYGHANALFDSRPQAPKSDVTLDLRIDYTNAGQYLQFVTDQVTLTDAGHIAGHLSSADSTTHVEVKMGNIGIADTKMKGLKLMLDANASRASTTISADNMTLPLAGKIGRTTIHSSLTDNRVQTNFEWNNDKLHTGGQIDTDTRLSRNERHLMANIGINPTNIVLRDDEWHMQKADIEVRHNGFDISGFRFSKGDERYIALDGHASGNATDTLSVDLSNITIEDILSPDPYERYSLAGDLSAHLQMMQLYNAPIVNCNADIDRFIVCGDNLDHLDVQTEWSTEAQNIGVDLSIVTHGHTAAHATGNIDSEHGQMNLNFDIDSLSLGFLNFYLGKSVENVRGSTSGKLQLHGPLNDIGLDAQLVAHRTDFRVRSTLVDYTFCDDDSVILTPTNMIFSKMGVKDKYGNRGIFDGNIRHDMFSNLDTRLSFEVKDMLVMDLKQADSPTYWGTIYADGRLDVTGSVAETELFIKAQTRPNTTLSVAPTAKSNQLNADYIKFTQEPDPTDNDDNKQTENNTASTNINDAIQWLTATIDVKVSPTAHINVIIDPRTDNKIVAKGNGDLRLIVDRAGDFKMNGSYAIDNGLYNFSLEQIVTKKFEITSGSKLNWDGDPFNPRLDVKALYKTRASLYDLVQDASNADIKKRVPINIRLFLKERMSDPNIQFKIELPSTMNFNQYTIDQYISTEEELNKQVFSLLAANTFLASDNSSGTQNSTNGATVAGTALSDLISNQLSSWISQNRYNLGIGFNYRPGDDVLQEEYELELSTQILNNKITLSGNIGYGRSTTETSEGSVIGDLDVEVKINKKGNLRAKAYTHSNNDVIYETSPTTQGIGISFHEDFDSFRELIRGYIDAIRRRREKRHSEQNADTVAAPLPESPEEDKK